MDVIDCTVVGAGVIGIATARALALAGKAVLAIESERIFGSHTSSRNSEVIHAGIYYPKDSLKARLCVEGRERLYRYCEKRSIPYRKCGKLIVAAHPDEFSKLDEIRRAAAANGVDDLNFLSRAEAMALEPELACAEALFSPSTGIVDSHAYMVALLGEAEARGAQFVFNTIFDSATVEAEGIVVRTGGADAYTFSTRTLINAAGLCAPAVARKIEGLSPSFVPHAYYAKGNYFACAGHTPFARLVYPVPEPGGLGIHFTLDLDGRGRFGPDVQWVDKPTYEVDATRSHKFYAAIRRYWPALEDGALEPAFCGIRPKISGPDEPAADFRISDMREHGVRGLVNLFGIESPGLTASLALADLVVAAV